MLRKTIIGLILAVMVLSALPFALIAKSRASKSTRTAPHLVLDMDKQPRFDPQAPNRMFADGRAMRPQVVGTVAREDLVLRNEALTVPTDAPRMVGGEAKDLKLESPEQFAAVMYGRVRSAGMSDDVFNAIKPPAKPNDAAAQFYLTGFPAGVTVTEEFVQRGRERFNIYCSPCHGQAGYGDGMVQRHVEKLKDVSPDAVSAWVQPANLNDDERRGRPVGSIFTTISNGVRNMPAYDKQISILDRWAVVAYVKALQRSQGSPAPVAQK